MNYQRCKQHFPKPFYHVHSQVMKSDLNGPHYRYHSFLQRKLTFFNNYKNEHAKRLFNICKQKTVDFCAENSTAPLVIRKSDFIINF